MSETVTATIIIVGSGLAFVPVIIILWARI